MIVSVCAVSWEKLFGGSLVYFSSNIYVILHDSALQVSDDIIRIPLQPFASLIHAAYFSCGMPRYTNVTINVVKKIPTAT